MKPRINIRSKRLQKNASNGRGGIASLPTVLVIAVLILAVTVGIAAITLSEAFVSLGQNQSQLALQYAQAGAKDALQRIARDKTYTCATADCYSIDFATGGCTNGTACARISVSAGTGAAGNPKIITSKGIVNANVRRVQVSVLLDSSLNGEIATTTWSDLSN